MLKLYSVSGRWMKYEYKPLIEWSTRGKVCLLWKKWHWDKSPCRSQVLWFSCVTPLMLGTHISFIYLRRYINLAIDSVDRPPIPLLRKLGALNVSSACWQPDLRLTTTDWQPALTSLNRESISYTLLTPRQKEGRFLNDTANVACTVKMI
jgi:hypothetical protein